MASPSVGPSGVRGGENPRTRSPSALGPRPGVADSGTMSSRPQPPRRPPQPSRRPAQGRPPAQGRKPARAPRQDGHRPWYRRRVALWLIVPGLILLFLVVVLFSYVFAAVPLPPDVQPTVVLDQAGREVAQLTFSARQKSVELAPLPERVRNAVVAAEDDGVYEHQGVSLPGIFRAAFKNLTARRVAQGGSTISQQYIEVATEE